MLSVRLLAESGFAGVGNADRWYVSDGATAVGPVELGLLARGIEAGKVPLRSYVRHEAWSVWRPLSEVAEVSVDSAVPTPPPPFRLADTLPSADDITLPGRAMLPDEMSPSDALEGAVDFEDALRLLLSAAVRHVSADVAFLHRVEGHVAEVFYAHGLLAHRMIGVQTSLSDPVMALARSGRAVVSEPSPGPAGRVLVERLARLGTPCEAAYMHPIFVRGQLEAVLELGRQKAWLRTSELAIIERLVDALPDR